MNLLAHLHLSNHLPAPIAAGNLLADFLRRLDAAPPDSDFEAGVRLHRAIDAFADAHPAIRQVRSLLRPPWRRLGGIVVDVACDFCLSRDWQRHSPIPLREYVSARLSTIQRYLRARPSPLLALLERATAEEWLFAYASPEGLELTFRRMSRRSPAAAALAGAETEILRLQPELQDAFDRFYPQVRARFVPRA